VIRFRDVDLHRSRIEEFVDKLPLRIAHAHRNSFAPISDLGVPLALEVTWERSHGRRSAQPSS